MKNKMILLTALASLSLGVSPALAQDSQAPPVREALLQSSPAKRLEAVQFVRSAYPGMVKDIYSQLKADYPELEHGLVDAGLKTWQEHPGEVMSLAEEVRTRYGARLQKLRQAVHEEMEVSYPNYRTRLSKILEQHGPASRWVKFMEAYNAPLLGQSRQEVKAELPEAKAWYPGKFRTLWAQAEPGSSPGFDRLRGLVTKNPELAPRMAEKLVTLTRKSSPGLAEDATKHFLDHQGQLAEALKTEFPGAGQRIVAVMERSDPTLAKDITSFVRDEAGAIRADFRSNLASLVPGFESRLAGIVSQRYPRLQEQMLQILK